MGSWDWVLFACVKDHSGAVLYTALNLQAIYRALSLHSNSCEVYDNSNSHKYRNPEEPSSGLLG